MQGHICYWIWIFCEILSCNLKSRCWQQILPLTEILFNFARMRQRRSLNIQSQTLISSASYFNLEIEAFSGGLSNDGTEFRAPLTACPPPIGGYGVRLIRLYLYWLASGDVHNGTLKGFGMFRNLYSEYFSGKIVRTKMSWTRRGLKHRSTITWPVNKLVTLLRSAVSLLSVSFVLLLKRAKCHCKIYWKIREKSVEIWAKSQKTFTKFLKSEQTPENMSKNGTQRRPK